MLLDHFSRWLRPVLKIHPQRLYVCVHRQDERLGAWLCGTLSGGTLWLSGPLGAWLCGTLSGGTLWLRHGGYEALCRRLCLLARKDAGMINVDS